MKAAPMSWHNGATFTLLMPADQMLGRGSLTFW